MNNWKNVTVYRTYNENPLSMLKSAHDLLKQLWKLILIKCIMKTHINFCGNIIHGLTSCY